MTFLVFLQMMMTTPSRRHTGNPENFLIVVSCGVCSSQEAGHEVSPR